MLGGFGATYGNRTRAKSLGSFCSTIKLKPLERLRFRAAAMIYRGFHFTNPLSKLQAEITAKHHRKAICV